MSDLFPARVTKPTLAVAKFLLSLQGSSTYGLEIGKGTGLGSASVYSVLDRFEEYGWLESEWESNNSRKGARRRMYSVTQRGTRELQLLVSAAQQKSSNVNLPGADALQARGA